MQKAFVALHTGPDRRRAIRRSIWRWLDRGDRRRVDYAPGDDLLLDHQLLDGVAEPQWADRLAALLAASKPVADAGALAGAVLVVTVPGDHGVEQVSERLRILHRRSSIWSI
jgi:hypothetical protein